MMHNEQEAMRRWYYPILMTCFRVYSKLGSRLRKECFITNGIKALMFACIDVPI